MEKIGLLAGTGHLPIEFARAAKAAGYEVCAVALLPETDPGLEAECADFRYINIAKLGGILKHLQKSGVKKVTMLGKVTKELLMNGRHELPDFKMVTFLATLPNRKDDTIMLGFVRELNKAGIEVLDQTVLIRLLMPETGCLTKRKPTADEEKDIAFGLRMAKELGRLDVGQTVVVKGLAVMALEAIEGTDACIARGGELARGGLINHRRERENMERNVRDAFFAIYAIERTLPRCRPTISRWKGFYMANTDKWYYAYVIEGDTIKVVDACHAQNMHE